jgi:hypothetical protein
MSKIYEVRFQGCMSVRADSPEEAVDIVHHVIDSDYGHDSDDDRVEYQPEWHVEGGAIELPE